MPNPPQGAGISETTVNTLIAATNPVKVRKTADKVLNNVAVLENDNHLLMAVGANEVWQIDLFVLCQGDQAADIKFAFSYPIGCVIKWGGQGSGEAVHTNTWGFTGVAQNPQLLNETHNVPLGIHATNVTGYRLSLIVTNGGNAGNINFQWAQNAAQVADTTVFENSCIIAHQLA